MTSTTSTRAVLLLSLAYLGACAETQHVSPESPAAEGVVRYAADGGSMKASAPAELTHAVQDAARHKERLLQPDARLDQLATWAGAQPEAPSAQQLELQARRLGLYDPQFALLTQPSTPGDSPQGSALPLSAAVTRKLADGPFNQFGAAWHTRAGQRQWTVVLSTRLLRLEALPTTVPLNAGLRLRAHVPEGFNHARIERISAQGRVVISGTGRELSLQLPTPQPGLQRITIVADGARGDVILAKLPVYVGVPFPSAAERTELDYDQSAVARAIFDSINRERSKAGLSALVRDPRLDKVAEQHNVDMRAHDFMGHVSERTGNATDRVARAGLPTSLVLETIARGATPSALEADGSVAASELHNVLSQAVTHVGIGVASQRDATGTVLVATELFVELPERIEPATAKPRLLSLLNEARVHRGVATLVLDTGLSSVADQAAERFLQDPEKSEKTLLAETDRELSHFSLAYRRVHSLLVTARHLEDALVLEPDLDTSATGLGIGIAQGERAGTQVLAVVMLVGTER